MSDFTQSMDSLVECPLCLEPFTDPRMLTTCFHTLCYACLGDYLKHNGENGQFKCPVCRKMLPIPENGADTFPKNFFVNKCLDLVSNTKSKTEGAADTKRHELKGACSNSKEDYPCGQLEKFCLKCCEAYCTLCSKAHGTSKATLSHAQVSKEDLTEKLFMDAMSQSETPRCLKHKKKLKLFCKTCKDAVCSVCSHIGHKKHSFQELAEIDNDLRTELENIRTSVQTSIENSEEATADTKRSEQQVEQAVSAARKAMAQVSLAVQQMLDRKTTNAERKLRQISEESKSQIQTQNKNLSLHHALLESLDTHVHDLLYKGTVYNRFVSLPEVRSRLQKIQSSTQASKQKLCSINAPFDVVAAQFDDLKLQVNLGSHDSLDLVLDFKCTVRQYFLQAGLPQTRVGDTQNKQRGNEPSEARLQVALPLAARAKRHECALPSTSGGFSSDIKKPKLRVVTYGIGSIGQAIDMVKDELQLDGKMSLGKRLIPLATDRLQVDILTCVPEENMRSVATDYGIDEKIAASRNLVLYCETYGSSLEETLDTLGQQAIKLFKLVIWSSDWHFDSSESAMANLADYMREISGAKTRGARTNLKRGSSVANNVMAPQRKKQKVTVGSGKEKPKMRVVTYGFGSIWRAIDMVKDELQLDGKMVHVDKRLIPLATDRLQVDILTCVPGENMRSVATKYGINDKIAANRNLVLYCETYGSSREETLHTLGQQAKLFQLVLWSSDWHFDSSESAMANLADYMRGVGRKANRK